MSKGSRVINRGFQDHPEWIAVHLYRGEVYCSLTNNRQRVTPDAANPRPQNAFGHIIR